MNSNESFVIVSNDFVSSSNCNLRMGIENHEADLLGNFSIQAMHMFVMNLHQQNENLKEKLWSVNNKLQELVNKFVIQKQDAEKEEIALIELRTNNETLKKEKDECIQKIENLHEKLRNVHTCLKEKINEFIVLEKKYNEIIEQNAKKTYEDAGRETEKNMLLMNEKKLKAQVERLTIELQEKCEKNNKLKDLKKINEDLTKRNKILGEDTLRLNQSVMVLKEHIQIIQKQFSVQLKDDVQGYLKQISELKTNKDILQKQVMQLKAECNHFQCQEQSLMHEIECFKSEIHAQNKELEKERNMATLYEKKLLAAEWNCKSLSENQDILVKQFKSEKEFLRKKISDCANVVTDSAMKSRAKYEEHSKEWKNKVKELESEVQQKERQIQDFPYVLSIQLEDYKIENHELSQKVKDLQSEAEKLCARCQRNQTNDAAN